MEQGGKMRPLLRRSLSLEDVVVYLYTNRFTFLPLAGDDYGIDKRKRTSLCLLSIQRPDCQAYLALSGNGSCSPSGLGHILFPELAESAPRSMRSQESRGLTWLSSPSRPIFTSLSLRQSSPQEPRPLPFPELAESAPRALRSGKPVARPSCLLSPGQ